MARSNKLATSIGIELTYVPRYAVEVYHNHGIDISENLQYPFTTVMKKAIEKAGIVVDKVTADPHCVEVPTVPHTKRNALNKDIKAITKVAKQSGLIPQPDYFCGGGAHIHAGIAQLTGTQQSPVLRREFAKRAQVFAAANPWLTWAFSGINDESNARTLTLSHLMDNGTSRTDLIMQINSADERMARYVRSIVKYEKSLHVAINWGSEYMQRNIEGELEYCRDNLNAARQTRARLRKQLAEMNARDMQIKYDDINTVVTKAYSVVMRGDTIEFRAFLMPHKVSELNRYIELVEAVMLKAKSEMDTLEFNGQALYDGEPMPYKVAKAGFHAMLEALGLDPDAYRADLYRMALRARYKRKAGGLT